MENDGSWIGAGSGDIGDERFYPDGDGISDKLPQI
jgi:hypothetical protein